MDDPLLVGAAVNTGLSGGSPPGKGDKSDIVGMAKELLVGAGCAALSLCCPVLCTGHHIRIVGNTQGVRVQLARVSVVVFVLCCLPWQVVSLDVLSRNDFDVPGVSRDPATVSLIDTGMSIMPVVVPMAMDTVKQQAFTQGSIIALQVSARCRVVNMFPFSPSFPLSPRAPSLPPTCCPPPLFVALVTRCHDADVVVVACVVCFPGPAPVVRAEQSWTGPLCSIQARRRHGTQSPVQLHPHARTGSPALL